VSGAGQAARVVLIGEDQENVGAFRGGLGTGGGGRGGHGRRGECGSRSSGGGGAEKVTAIHGVGRGCFGNGKDYSSCDDCVASGAGTEG